VRGVRPGVARVADAVSTQARRVFAELEVLLTVVLKRR
jgi:hypothetical protein